jgi:16S rRNA (adenine1518-N6/adenine1519-N6)-dimethyltransferase
LTQIKTILDSLGVRPSKRRGQNFLLDKDLVRRIVEFADLEKSDAIVEIGPGLGALTSQIVSQDKILVVELEPHFCDYLKDSLPGLPPENVWCRDVLTTSLEECCAALGVERCRVMSNVPYSISTDVILWLIENRKYLTDATLLLQREYAERIASAEGSKRYGSLSVLRALYADAELGPKVPGSCFHPPANVESLVLKLHFLDEPRLPVRNEKFFTKIVRTAFNQRRKTLRNSLASGELAIPKDKIEEALGKLSISPSLRAERLSLEQFVAIADVLGEDHA